MGRCRKCVLWGAHAASRAVIGDLANRRGMASPRASSLVSGGNFGEPPKSAREPRALPRGVWLAAKKTTSYCDFIFEFGREREVIVYEDCFRRGSI